MGVAEPRVLWGARLALASAVALVGAACSAPAEEPADDTSNAASETSTVPVTDEPTVTYAVHEVDPPGEFDGRLYGDDMLLVSTKTIPADVVDRIMRIRIAKEKAVTAAEPLSIGQFSLENKSYTVAAVDAAGYRSFTPQLSAGLQNGWERVAAGEIAVDRSLEKRLPLDKNGYLEVGSGERTYPIHVGAYVDHVGTIDTVVNTEWGEALGLVENNALVLYTGGISPQALRKELKPIVGDISMTDLDIVAETGLDPNTFQSVQYVGTFAEAVGVFNYTPIGGGRVQPEASWVRTHIVTEQVPILGSVTCNKFMMPQLRAALLEVQSSGLAAEIHPDEYAGCYYPRFIAGSTTLSNHSFGLAFDINVPGNQRGTVGQISRAVVAIFKKWGFAWGGDWNYTDPMHFEMDHIVNPG
jgi:hypothetical protein